MNLQYGHREDAVIEGAVAKEFKWNFGHGYLPCAHNSHTFLLPFQDFELTALNVSGS